MLAIPFRFTALLTVASRSVSVFHPETSSHRACCSVQVASAVVVPVVPAGSRVQVANVRSAEFAAAEPARSGPAVADFPAGLWVHGSARAADPAVPGDSLPAGWASADCWVALPAYDPGPAVDPGHWAGGSLMVYSLRAD